jgi:transcriptional regulator with XRE-family HTH domain
MGNQRNPTKKEFGKLVRQRRLQLGLTTRQLADQVGVTSPTISRLERGASPRPAHRATLTQLLDLDAVGARHSTGHRGAHAPPGPRPTWWPAATLVDARAKIEEALQLLVQAHQESGGQLTPASMKATFTANTELAWAVLAVLRLDKRPLFENDHPDRLVVVHVGTWALDTKARWFFEQLGAVLPVSVGPHGGAATALKTSRRLDRLTRTQRRKAAQDIKAQTAKIVQAARRHRQYADRLDLDAQSKGEARKAEERNIRRARSEQRRVLTAGSRPVGSPAERERIETLVADIDNRAIPVKVAVRYVPRPPHLRPKDCRSALEWARRRCGRSRTRVARRLNISVDTLRAWEQGDGQPTFPQLRQLAALYQVAIAVLRQS